VSAGHGQRGRARDDRLGQRLRRHPGRRHALGQRVRRLWGRRVAVVVLCCQVALIAACMTPDEIGPVLAAQPVGDAQATVETQPVGTSGDAADDPAVWVDAKDPGHSAVIGNDKGGALEVYDLAGKRLQRISEGFFGNVDVQQGFVTGAGTVDLVVTYRAGVRVYRIDPSTRQLDNITDAPDGSIPTPAGGEGLCLYKSPDNGALYAFSNTRDGRVAQFALTDEDRDGLVEGAEVRSWDVGSEIEACVADNDSGDVYISEEGVGIWRYGAEPADSTTERTKVDGLVGAGGQLRADVEGLALVYQADGKGYLLASAQGGSADNFYAAYERQGSNSFLRTFRIVDGSTTDGCSHTDGITAVAANLGPSFPRGVFICQDDSNTTPGSSGNQNFKLVPLERVVGFEAPGPA
jgi:myo-inositol-hexaphosphate 3-phosphohydrolase